MNASEKIEFIVNWLTEYQNKAKTNGFVIGISGGIDSAVTSTLCAKTGFPIWCINMPIHQEETQFNRAANHINWLQQNFNNTHSATVDLTSTFEGFKANIPADIQDQLSLANTRARLRMTTLYNFACSKKMLVAGTGNKIEDFGIGFFTKYGDGGVDLSPIADLTKTEVFELATELGIIDEIQNAAPTDGLWGDDRTDEDQIGASYPELEWAMEFSGNEEKLTQREKEVRSIYKRLNSANQHKMQPIPVCILPKN